MELTVFLRCLRKMSKDEDYEVRRSVAENSNTPAEVLTEMSKDENCEVRCAVAANPNTPVEVLKEMLSKEKDFRVRVELEKNPKFSS